MNHPVVELKSLDRDDYDFNEAINTLRTNVQFCGSNIKRIMITSSLPDEGKSGVCFSRAHYLGPLG